MEDLLSWSLGYVCFPFDSISWMRTYLFLDGWQNFFRKISAITCRKLWIFVHWRTSYINTLKMSLTWLSTSLCLLLFHLKIFREFVNTIELKRRFERVPTIHLIHRPSLRPLQSCWVFVSTLELSYFIEKEFGFSLSMT